ncbi:hypothetical protein GQ457_02G027290 [Hibiscus cannabinus]
MFDLAINTTLDPKTLELPPTQEKKQGVAAHPNFQGVMRFLLVSGKKFPGFCSQVYSGRLSRDPDVIFMEIKDSSVSCNQKIKDVDFSS